MTNKPRNGCRPRLRRLDALALLLACALSPTALAGTVEWPGEDELYLEVSVNQSDKPALHRFLMREGRLHASPATLRELGLRVSDADMTADALPLERNGVQAAYDQARQHLAISAPLSELVSATTRVDARTAGDPVSPAPPGALFNYDVDISGGRGQQRYTNIVATPEVRIFGLGRAMLESNGIVHLRRGDGLHESQAVRLDTRMRWTYPERAIEVIVGDFNTRGPHWSRASRMGGVSIGTNYSQLQPFLPLSPGPVFAGESVVPSNVELYVNGIKQLDQPVPVGPFVVSGLPSMEGRGDASLVVTDAYGRSRRIDIPFYGTQRLLAPGLDDWSVSLGRVRLDYGVASNRYAGTRALDASWRRGLNARMTGELHVQAGDGLRLGGVGGAWLLGQAGVVNAAWSQSRAHGLQGSLRAWGYQWSSGRFNFSLDSQRTRGDYRDLPALASGFLPARVSESAAVGLSLSRLGSINLAYTHLAYVDQPRNRLAGLYWNGTLGERWYASAGANVDLDDRARTSFSLSLVGRLGERRHWQASVQRQPSLTSSQLEVVQQARVNGDVGWRVQARRDGEGRTGALASATWLTPVAELGAGVARQSGQSEYRLGARGSVVWLGGSLMPARQVSSGLALVDAGYPGIPVLLENRAYGVTNRRGQLIVTPLFPFQRNRVSIDPTALPADVRVPIGSKRVVPGASGVARVDFAVQRVRAAVIVLHDAAGQPLPLGSRVQLAGSPVADADDAAVVGYDGEVYLEGLSQHNVLHIEGSAGSCSVGFELGTAMSTVPRIGPLTCIQEKRP